MLYEIIIRQMKVAEKRKGVHVIFISFSEEKAKAI